MSERNVSVTIKDVAKEAHVSIATVSRVLNNSNSVTEATRCKVLQIMEELGYNRNEVARSLKIRQTKTIGIIAPELSNIFFMELVETLDRVLAPRGYTMLITSSNDSIEEEQKKLQVFIERNVDALIVIPAGNEGSHFTIKALSHIPLIMVDRTIEGLSVDAVLTDNRYGVKLLIQALWEDGHRRIGFIGGSVSIHTAKERLAGFIEAMGNCQLAIEEEFMFTDDAMTFDAGRRVIAQFLSRDNHPTAFFVANDMLHLGVASYLSDLNSTGSAERIVLASFDYSRYTPLSRYCRYAVAQPLEQLGEEVAKLVLSRLEGNTTDPIKNIVLRPAYKVLKERS